MEERIRELLFKDIKDLPDATIRTLMDNGFLPDVSNKKELKEWKASYVGHFVMKYPKRSGELRIVCALLRRNPELYDFTEDVLNEIVHAFKLRSPGTAKEYASRVKTIISNMIEENPDLYLPCRTYKKILSLPSSPTTKPFLNMNDVKALLSYKPESEAERICHARFIVSIMTGARISDVCSFTRENITDGMLSYVPKKTKTKGTIVTIPVSEVTAKYIDIASEKPTMYHVSYNGVIREICRKCGLTEEVKFFYAGKYVVKEKWEAMRSHLGRVSFVTLMLEMGQQIQDVSKMAGHTDINMTARYNASTDVKLNDKAKAFINMDF